jgi:ribonuclease BN (tRNA processing enzyme)
MFTQSALQFDVHDLPTNAVSDGRLVIDEDGLRVSAISVDHRDVPAVAYRVEHAGRSLVVTGDLASKNDNLPTLAAGSDLLVYDTAVMDPPGSTEALYELHTAPKRIGEVAAQARVKSLLLSHLTGRVVDHADEVMHSVQTGFKGDARFAQDCMTLEVDAPRDTLPATRPRATYHAPRGVMSHTRRIGRSRSSSETGSPSDASDTKDGVSSI